MQPLYSVDHETRHNSNHPEDNNEPRPTETTPLVQFIPYNTPPRNPVTTVIVSLLLIILIAGVIIGIYLLVLQNESENVLPPVDLPLQLVSRSQWDRSNLSQPVLKSSPYRLKQVIVVQTNTDQCWSTETCTKLLQEMQANVTAARGVIPYNFLISSNGQTYEALGWQKSSPMSTKQPSNGLVLAFIGNYNQVLPTRSQMQEAKKFFAESVSQQYLHPSFSIIGKNVNDTPMRLSQSFKVFPQWNNELVDNITN